MLYQDISKKKIRLIYIFNYSTIYMFNCDITGKLDELAIQIHIC